MPNWCSNTVTLTHEDPEMISRARAAFQERRLLQEFVPVPQELLDTEASYGGDDEVRVAREKQEAANIEKYGYANWYDFSVGEWGTKWDVGGEYEDYSDDSDHQLVLTFDSAWAPPVEAYKKMISDHGFSVDAYYYEPGMGFAGIFRDEQDEYYEYGDMSPEEIEENLPQELDEMFGISDDARYWRDEATQENQEIILDPIEDEL